ncbi:MAG TPA: acyl-CoA thioesterase [Verrucomicrobiae bacterium]|nr:acyl-CoA thioesterase [Verrucomicrobiae bacterium]
MEFVIDLFRGRDPAYRVSEARAFSRFETELEVRPDDLDMFRHVHASRYQDYVLAARFEQMKRCYKMSMEDFLARGLGWFVDTAHLEYKRQLGIGEQFIVKTWVQEILPTGVRVDFEILKKPTRKLSCHGHFTYTLIDLSGPRAIAIPPDILEKYSI